MAGRPRAGLVTRLSAGPSSLARVSLTVGAPRGRVWAALLDPIAISRYLPVTDVRSDWRVGAPITWQGELGGKSIRVEGVVLRIEPERTLEYRYVNPYSRAAHRVTMALIDEGTGTRVDLTEDGQKNDRELAHAVGGWQLALVNLKALLERG